MWHQGHSLSVRISRIAQNRALSQLFLCIHNPDAYHENRHSLRVSFKGLNCAGDHTCSSIWIPINNMSSSVPRVNCSYASTTLIIHWTTISRFLCNFFPRTAPQFFSIMIHQVIWPRPSLCPQAIHAKSPAKLSRLICVNGGSEFNSCFSSEKQSI